MSRNRPLPVVRGLIFSLGVGVVAALVLLGSVSVRSEQNPAPPERAEVLSPASAVNNQAAVLIAQPKEEKEKSNLEKTRADAAELSALADQLRDELKKMNVNVLSLDVIEKTEKLERLAKKIKGEAHGQ